MATIGNLKTLLDWSKEVDPDGSTAAVAELLSQQNGMVSTILWKEGNLPTGHRITQRTGLPTSYWRLLNKGTPSSKATTAQVDEACGMLEGRSEIDEKLAALNGNTGSFRVNQAAAHIESMNQEFASTAVYGTASNPEEFIGFAARYNDLSADNGDNILSAGGSSSDNTSVYLIGWGERSIYGIYPKGSMAGLSHEDLGVIDAFDADNNRFRAYGDLFQWDGGIAVEDWRYGVRIPNIDVSDLQGQTGTQAASEATALIKLMTRAVDRLQSRVGVDARFYCNRTVASHLRLAALDKSQSVVTVEPATNQFGQTIFELHFQGIPVEIEDQITNSESAVS